ncbi:ABC-2 type transporter ATPase, partial [mine drainage metagenome]
HGSILRRGTPEELRLSTVGAEAVEVWQDAALDAATVEAVGDELRHWDRHQDALVLYADQPGRIGERMRGHGLQPQRMLVRPTDLEDVFLTLTGRDLRE